MQRRWNGPKNPLMLQDAILVKFEEASQAARATGPFYVKTLL